MRATRLAGLVLAAAVALNGCEGEPSASPDNPERTSEASSCVSTGVGGTTVRLTVPGDFRRTTDADAANLLDQVWFRPNDDGYADLVTLHAFDPDRYGADKPDEFVLMRAMLSSTPGGVSDTGTPGFERAADQAEGGDTEVTYTAPNRGGDGSHSVYAVLRTVGDDRYTVTVTAPAGEPFESLRDDVISSVDEGPCT